MDRTELVELIDQVLRNASGSPDVAGRIADCVMEKYILIHQVSDDSEDWTANWRARDEHHRKVADIKALPVTGDEIQFKFPDICPKLETPTGRIDFIPLRRPDESIEEWGGRCIRLENVGDPKE